MTSMLASCITTKLSVQTTLLDYCKTLQTAGGPNKICQWAWSGQLASIWVPGFQNFLKSIIYMRWVYNNYTDKKLNDSKMFPYKVLIWGVHIRYIYVVIVLSNHINKLSKVGCVYKSWWYIVRCVQKCRHFENWPVIGVTAFP